MNEEEFWKLNDEANIHFDIIHRIGSLTLMISLTESKLEEFSGNGQWYDKNDTRLANKHRMKEMGRMIGGYRQNIQELSIIGLAKTIEDLLYDLKDKLDLNINFWKDCNEYNHYEEMKIIRSLNNCIKHNKGIICSESNSGKYLENIAGFESGTIISSLQIDLEKYAMQCFLFQMDIFWKQIEKENPYVGIKDKYDEIKKILIPAFINLEI
jgi:hypothetical protein